MRDPAVPARMMPFVFKTSIDPRQNGNAKPVSDLGKALA
jgi:hypothetical protein